MHEDNDAFGRFNHWREGSVKDTNIWTALMIFTLVAGPTTAAYVSYVHGLTAVVITHHKFADHILE